MQKKIKNYIDFISKQPKGFVYSDKNIKISERKKNPMPDKNSNLKQEKLDAIKKRYKNCTDCPIGSQGRTQVVFGHGNINSKIIFVGEGPGRDEDAQGIPFIGRAGQLLTRIMDASGIKRNDIYISNVVKCRPPNNRTPLPNESKICKNKILYKEIEIIKPKIICTLGSVATQEILNKPVSITKIRGQFLKLNGILILPTLHPAYLLRNPSKKKDAWEDMKKIAKKLEEF